VRWNDVQLFQLLRLLQLVSKETSIPRSRHEETRELPREIDDAMNARCMQARKTTHGLLPV